MIHHEKSIVSWTQHRLPEAFRSQPRPTRTSTRLQGVPARSPARAPQNPQATKQKRCLRRPSPAVQRPRGPVEHNAPVTEKKFQIKCSIIYHIQFAGRFAGQQRHLKPARLVRAPAISISVNRTSDNRICGRWFMRPVSKRSTLRHAGVLHPHRQTHTHTHQAPYSNDRNVCIRCDEWRGCMMCAVYPIGDAYRVHDA